MGLDEILYLRFANTILEPRSRCTYIECVEINMAESFGVEDRGHSRSGGALRDVVVNHLMQVVAAAAIEPPAGRDRKRSEAPTWHCCMRSGTPTRRTMSGANTTVTAQSQASLRFDH